MMPVPAKFYEERIVQCTENIRLARSRLASLALFRLLAFGWFALAGYYFIKQPQSALLLFSLAGLVVFVGLIRHTIAVREQKALHEKLLYVNTNERDMLQHLPNKLDDGTQYNDKDKYSSDLDIFGPGSIFQLLNRASTSHGRQQLAKQLQQPLLDPKQILEKQDAVKQLAPQGEARQLMTASGLLNEEKEGTLDDVFTWLQLTPAIYGNEWLRLLRFAWPAVNLLLLLYYLYSDMLFPLVLGVAMSWLITGLFLKEINRQHALLSKKQAILDQYASILAQFVKASPGNSEWLLRLHADASGARAAIRQLSRLSALFDQRLNMLVNVFLNSFALYDLQCLHALERWRERYREGFGKWVQCVGEIECLNSLATYAFNNPGYCYPEPKNGKVFITADNIEHPLIPGPESVPNDFSIGIDSRMMLITGSNMSGKTTFLRTVGVNLLLAQNGAPVRARSFSFSPMHILSSIRVSDSLQEHTSYFMAELKKLHEIIATLEKGQPCLVLIDEILRGTNSDDKTHGSEKFIRKLIRHNCISLFATHDLVLSKLEDEMPGIVNNACFESIIKDDDLIFDYKLQPGIAKNRNASFLMRKMGIISS